MFLGLKIIHVFMGCIVEKDSVYGGLFNVGQMWMRLYKRDKKIKCIEMMKVRNVKREYLKLENSGNDMFGLIVGLMCIW